MKKFITIVLLGAFGFSLNSCETFLDTSSSSVVDAEFVFSDAASASSALLYAYEQWRGKAYVHSNGLFYDLAVVGSDIEHHPESYSTQTRHIPEYFYPGGTENFDISFSDSETAWTALYTIVSVTNSLINAFEASNDMTELLSGEPTELSDIYGQAVALRATAYHELVRFYGDVPHVLTTGDTETKGLTSRDEIYEYHINKLIEVEPYMFRIGEGTSHADIMTRTYVQGLIGRMCLYAGGYATRRTDLGADFYKKLDGTTISFEVKGAEKNGAVYSRRSDWQDYFQIAKTYLSACYENSGSAYLVTSDPRKTTTAGQQFGNPYQYVFQMMLTGDELSDESVYEIPEEYAYYSERPYAFGRPSNGGGSNAYPCKSYGQSRMQAHYYYGSFDPKDLRRDVTVAITSSKGDGTEQMISWTPGSKGQGGIANNKWDENRMSSPFTTKQRKSGINTPYMRMSDVILMLAEVESALGDDGTAKTHLALVHNRAFASTADADLDGFISKSGSVYEAVLEERALEFGGEGMRRYDLIRTGKIGEAVVKNRELMTEIVEAIDADGYYEFDNGNQLPAYIWTKSVDAKSEYGYRLTTQCYDETDPVLFPSWRGQYDDWGSLGLNYGTETPATNVAIKGLFRYIAPGSDEATALEDDGYTQTAWGATIAANKEDYATGLFSGYSDADYAAGNPPIYVVPLSSTILGNSGISNGYGFQQ
ncbi:RagB/SusD family nutrient uptake outer membrane protein [Mangrovibacterium lignilyticum]|uniref:RagB/SusD family nutrient uptake outer membrane protein n=1 Tax=Mangrovibacterium lignilyticum TaxID=2668052 RepID=UPI0013D4A85A|nr:RagB/SusD family nutrient uptake outer membrane protein [Mangrovibacterium lignilyticum]